METLTTREKLEALLDLERGLSDWEVDFLEDLHSRVRKRRSGATFFTDAQTRKIDQIYQERIEEGRTAGDYRDDD